MSSKLSNLPELLAPAGSFEALVCAVKGGADAVYLGGNEFNARMNAKNFTEKELEKAVKYAHSYGVRLYAAVNTLIYEREFKDAMRYVAYLYSIGTDALITADLALCSAVAKEFPDFPIHASTQMGVHNSEAGFAMRDLGFSRMVTARELSMENIRTVCEKSPIEIEIFVHGALCVCHSGQCLMSSVIGARSGNRGECAQPCRMMYNGKYPLSLKDSCLAGHITDILSMNVASLKIEGRMKSPAYVYSVTSVYRRLLDEKRNADDAEIQRLASVFSRQGFTDGYFTNRISKKMNGIRTDADKNTSKNQTQDVKPLCKRQGNPIAPARFTSFVRDFEIQFPKAEKHCTARFLSADGVVKHDLFDIVYLPLYKFDGKYANGVILPPVVLDSEWDSVRYAVLQAEKNGAKHALVCNFGHISLLSGTSLTPHADYRFNLYSTASRDVLYRFGFADALLSPELTLPQIRDIKGDKGVVIYGRLPLMTLEKRLSETELCDRQRAVFPVVEEAGRSIVLNSCPVYMSDKKALLDKAGINHRHFIFSIEKKAEIKQIIDGYLQGKPVNYPIKRIKG